MSAEDEKRVADILGLNIDEQAELADLLDCGGLGIEIKENGDEVMVVLTNTYRYCKMQNLISGQYVGTRLGAYIYVSGWLDCFGHFGG